VETIDISYTSMAFMYAMLSIPIAIALLLKLGIVKNLLISLLRMTAQMALIGLYLEYLFRLNNVLVNFAWVLIIIGVANLTIQRNAGLRTVRMFLVSMAGVTFSSFFVIGVFVFLAIQPRPFYDARYLIPISGMVVGNCMQANVISLERFFNTIRRNEREYLTYLLMGASHREAARPYIGESIRPALAPILSTMATLGLVSLPGMMTGQILGGSPPIVAIKYQIAVMIAIFTAMVVSTSLNLLISLRAGFDRYQMLRRDVFRG
jgi:putative ABC transport system permease protein